MYEAHYGFSERPFSLLPDPRYLYLGPKHSVGLAIMEYALMNQAGFCVLTGEVGSGKTTLIRHLLNIMPKDTNIGLINNTHRAFGNLMQWILNAYEIECRSQDQAEMHRVWLDYLITQYSKNRRTLLIVDEAQNMDAGVLEELRVLSNINADQDQIFQVILVGQPELREILQREDMRQFAQRVVVDYHISPLEEQETLDYIRHRLSVAGAADSELISTEAATRVFIHSGGVPRLVNLLCDAALVYGFAKGAQRIDLDIVIEVVADKLRGNVVPLHGRELFASEDIISRESRQ